MPKTPVKEEVFDPVASGIIGNSFSNQKQSSESEEIVREILDTLLSTENIDTKTDLTAKQVLAFTKAEMYADTYKVPLLEKAVKKVSIRLLSKNRLSRKEFVEVAKSINTGVQAEQDPSMRDRLLGRAG